MRVLLVEDDRRIASDIARALEATGYVVETVSDGEEAWFRGDTEDYSRTQFKGIIKLLVLWLQKRR